MTEQQIAAMREIVRVVAEAVNSDMSVCYQLCNVRWYGGETDAVEMEMRHDAPCVVERARALLGVIEAAQMEADEKAEAERVAARLEEIMWLRQKERYPN